MDSSKCPAFVKDGQSGNNDYKTYAIGEDSSGGKELKACGTGPYQTEG